MPSEVFKFTGARSEHYDQYLGPFLFEPYGKAMADRVPVTGVNTVLELASGTGRVTRHLRDRLPSSVKLFASDLSPDMLEVAKRKFASSANLEFVTADMQNLPFKDQSFEVVVCQYGLMFPPDKAKVFAEVWRVLKPGGLFLFSTWERTDRVEIFKLIYDEHVIPFFAGEDPNRFVVPYSLHDTKQLLQFLQTAHFSNSNIERVVVQGIAETANDLVKGFFTKHAIGQEIHDRDRAAFESITRSMEQAIIQRFSDKPVVCELASFFGSGYKK